MLSALRIYDDVDPGSSQDAPVHPSVKSRTKRLLDVLVASAALILGLPIAAVIALLVAITSRGPILFEQERVGLCGRRFTVWKFRTMAASASVEPHREYVLSMIRGTNSEQATDGVYKLRADSRVTWIGALLRKTSLDEFPQFANVLRGEMSVVGPRPALAYEVDEYAAWQLERLFVRPGITGWWQVSGRNRMTYREMCARDIEYIRDWSLGWDLRIIARTPWVMISNSGRAA